MQESTFINFLEWNKMSYFFRMEQTAVYNTMLEFDVTGVEQAQACPQDPLLVCCNFASTTSFFEIC